MAAPTVVVLQGSEGIKCAPGAQKPSRGTSHIRLPKTDTIIGTWNVRSLFECGKTKKLIHELARYKWDALVLAETRWTGSGETITEEGQRIWYCGEDSKHQHEIGFIVNKERVNSVISCTPVNSRIISIRIAAKPNNFNIIQVYAPKSDYEEEVVEQFYEDLENNNKRVSKKDLLIVMGDWNAKVGEDAYEQWTGTVGCFGLGETNDRGFRLLEFASSHKLTLANNMDEGTQLTFTPSYPTPFPSPKGEYSTFICNIMSAVKMSAPYVPNLKPFPPLKNDLILRTARGERTEKVPVWVMRQAGRYLPEYKAAKGDTKFFATCRNPELVSELTIQPVKRFPVDAAIIFSDILVIPIALGMTVANDPGEGPVFAEPILQPEDVDRLKPDFDPQEELGYVYQAITRTRHDLQGAVPLFGFCGAPFTLMRFMVENVSAGPNVNRARRFLVEWPEAGGRLLTILKDAIVTHLVQQVIAGAQIVQVFDTYAGELGPALFARYELPLLRAIAAQVKEKLKEKQVDPVPMVVFCKDVHFALEELSNSGYDVVGLDWTIQPLHASGYDVVGLDWTIQPLHASGYDVVGLDWTIQPLHASGYDVVGLDWNIQPLHASGYDVVGLDWTIQPLHARYGDDGGGVVVVMMVMMMMVITMSNSGYDGVGLDWGLDYTAPASQVW
ncbi:hypothetical protein ACOMHN_028341 [Nucella lapillus]